MINPNTNDVSHWFFKNWSEANIKIVHPTKGLVPWKQYSYHDTIVEAIDVNRFVIVNKFRQAGISTMCVAHALWEAIWNIDKRIQFITKTDREARYLSHSMRQMITHLPEQSFGDVNTVHQNDHEITFESGSTILFHSAGYSKATTVDHLYIDEAAFIKDMDRYWQAKFPCLSQGGKATVVSTPNGASGWFYETMDGAVKGKNSFHPIRLSWRDHPDYNNPEWESQMLQNLGNKGFLQEIVGCFLTPDKTVKNDSNNDLQTIVNKLEELKLQILAQNQIPTNTLPYA